MAVVKDANIVADRLAHSIVAPDLRDGSASGSGRSRSASSLRRRVSRGKLKHMSSKSQLYREKEEAETAERIRVRTLSAASTPSIKEMLTETDQIDVNAFDSMLLSTDAHLDLDSFDPAAIDQMDIDFDMDALGDVGDLGDLGDLADFTDLGLDDLAEFGDLTGAVLGGKRVSKSLFDDPELATFLDTTIAQMPKPKPKTPPPAVVKTQAIGSSIVPVPLSLGAPVPVPMTCGAPMPIPASGSAPMPLPIPASGGAPMPVPCVAPIPIPVGVVSSTAPMAPMPSAVARMAPMPSAMAPTPASVATVVVPVPATVAPIAAVQKTHVSGEDNTDTTTETDKRPQPSEVEEKTTETGIDTANVIVSDKKPKLKKRRSTRTRRQITAVESKPKKKKPSKTKEEVVAEEFKKKMKLLYKVTDKREVSFKLMAEMGELPLANLIDFVGHFGATYITTTTAGSSEATLSGEEQALHRMLFVDVKKIEAFFNYMGPNARGMLSFSKFVHYIDTDGDVIGAYLSWAQTGDSRTDRAKGHLEEVEDEELQVKKLKLVSTFDKLRSLDTSRMDDVKQLAAYKRELQEQRLVSTFAGLKSIDSLTASELKTHEAEIVGRGLVSGSDYKRMFEKRVAKGESVLAPKRRMSHCGTATLFLHTAEVDDLVRGKALIADVAYDEEYAAKLLAAEKQGATKAAKVSTFKGLKSTKRVSRGVADVDDLKSAGKVKGFQGLKSKMRRVATVDTAADESELRAAAIVTDSTYSKALRDKTKQAEESAKKRRASITIETTEEIQAAKSMFQAMESKTEEATTPRPSAVSIEVSEDVLAAKSLFQAMDAKTAPSDASKRISRKKRRTTSRRSVRKSAAS